MKEWEICIEDYEVLKTEPDEDKHDSLLEIAKERIKFIEKNNQDEKYLSFIFELYYTSCIEMIHALALKEGYKINNHICLCSFICKKLKDKEKAEIFNKLRNKRNKIVYYGEKIKIETVKELIKELKKIINFLISF